MIKYRLFLIALLLFQSIVALSQQLDITEVKTYGDSATYQIKNETSESYLFWVNREPADSLTIQGEKELLGQFRRFTHYRPNPIPEHYMTLGSLITDGNVIHYSEDGKVLSSSVYSEYYELGINYIHRILPGETFVIKVYGDNERQNYFRDRFLTMKESLYFVKIDNPFISGDPELIIDYSDSTKFLENMRTGRRSLHFELNNLPKKELQPEVALQYLDEKAYGGSKSPMQCKYFLTGEYKRGSHLYYLIKKEFYHSKDLIWRTEIYLSLATDNKITKSLLIFQSLYNTCNQVVFAINDHNTLFITRMANPENGNYYIRQNAYDIETLEPIPSQSIE